MNADQTLHNMSTDFGPVFEYVIYLFEYFEPPLVLHGDIDDIEDGESSCEYAPEPDEFDDFDPAFDDWSGEPTRLGFQLASSREEAMTLFVQSRGFPTIGSFIDWGSEGGHLCISLDAWIADSCEYDEAESIARLDSSFEAINAQHRQIER